MGGNDSKLSDSQQKANEQAEEQRKAAEIAKQKAEEKEKERQLEEARRARERAQEEQRRAEKKERKQEKKREQKEEERERQREKEEMYERRLEENRIAEKERRDEERRRREEMELQFKRDQEQNKRNEEIRKREREEAAEAQRDMQREMHARDQAHAESALKMQAEMHKISLQAHREREEQVRQEREAQQQLANKQMEEMRSLHREDMEKTQGRHDDMMNLMNSQLETQQKQNERLMQNLADLLQQFTQSRDDFLSYVKEKPQKDIAVSEDMEETIRKAKADLHLDTVNFYNFAFVGRTKTGKSSLINSIRGIRDNHPDAAQVGITETTHEIKPYTFPDPAFQHVRIYDIPGAGTLTHNADSYYKDKCLCAFDCLVIVTQDTIGTEEINFAIQSLKFNQPITFVRSRCDIVLDNAKKSGEIDRITQQDVVFYINEMKKKYIEEIKRSEKAELCRVPCFFISSYSLRMLIQGKEPEAVYQEKEFVDFMTAKSKYSRNISSQ